MKPWWVKHKQTAKYVVPRGVIHEPIFFPNSVESKTEKSGNFSDLRKSKIGRFSFGSFRVLKIERNSVFFFRALVYFAKIAIPTTVFSEIDGIREKGNETPQAVRRQQ